MAILTNFECTTFAKCELACRVDARSRDNRSLALTEIKLHIEQE